MMGGTTNSFLREQLHERRQRLESAIRQSHETEDLVQLLKDVDSALERMDAGSYGICDLCQEPVETARLIADPLVRLCLEHLTADQQRALEQDLELASSLQRELLPRQNLKHDGWQISYHYEPLGMVSGDYCDVMVGDGEARNLFFILGDASGKGVAASMLMSHLHAIFRTLVATGLPTYQLVERASRIFRDSTMSPYFATLVCGRATPAGQIELCNAGHVPPLVVRRGQVTRLEATGLPVGLFRGGHYSTETVTLEPGDALFLYTDGLSEARSRDQDEYGEERVARVVSQHHASEPEALIRACILDLETFCAGAPLADDLTVMAVRRSIPQSQGAADSAA